MVSKFYLNKAANNNKKILRKDSELHQKELLVSLTLPK